MKREVLKIADSAERDILTALHEAARKAQATYQAAVSRFAPPADPTCSFTPEGNYWFRMVKEEATAAAEVQEG
jgi:hypothetical protein